MQSIQTAFLKPAIKPGHIPVFILLPTLKLGTHLALLLSRCLDVAAEHTRLSGVPTDQTNYFINDHTRRILQQLHRQSGTSLKERQSVLRLTVEEGIDSGKLWGLQCDYRSFFENHIYEIFDEALYLFVYSDQSEGAEETSLFAKEIECFAEAHPLASVVVSDYQIAELPQLLLEKLGAKMPSEYQVQVTSSRSDHAPLFSAFNEQLTRANTLIKSGSWLRGEELSVYLLDLGNTSARHLRKKLSSLLRPLTVLPKIFLLTSAEDQRQAFMQVLSELGLPSDSLQFVAKQHEVGKALNLLMDESAGEYNIIDNLLVDYPLSASVQPFLQQSMLDVSVISISGEAETVLNFADLITMQVVPDNICIRRSAWQCIGGFDETIDATGLLWDFALRTLAYTNSVPVFPAGRVNAGVEASATSQVISRDAKNQILAKHRQLLQQSVIDIMKALTEKEDLPTQQIKNLHYKLGSMQALLTHSKEELRALTDLSANLQRRINVLESRWYYQMGRRLKHLKAIFFKKKSPGTGALKRILNFFRFAFSKPGLRIVRKVVKGGFKKMYLVAEDRPVKIVYLDTAGGPANIFTYHDWIRAKLDSVKLRDEFDNTIEKLTLQPKISIVMPVYNTPVRLLREAIDSVVNQLYSNWELCIADDCSPDSRVRKLLHSYEVKYNNIKVCFRKENGHISASSNSALALATGDFVLLMDHDDLLTQNCLFEVVRHINKHPENDIVYSDEDKIDEDGQHSVPHFKPDWAPDSLMARNYFGHVVVIRRSILDEIGGFRLGFEGSQDYDLLLRTTERTQNIGHIPKVLYHWRIHDQSAAQSEEVKPYAYIAAKKALEEALVRRGTPGTVHYLSGLRGYRINYNLQTQAKISIIIPTKDQTGLLKNAIDSIFEKTEYRNFEILVLNNNSNSKEYYAFAEDYSQKHGGSVRFIDAGFPFNFSRLMNLGVRETNGEYILFLNNDVEVIHADWLTQMVSYAQHKHVGAVGVKLLYPDDTVQHAGVIVGLGGVAGHVFVQFHRDEPAYFNYLQSVNNFSAVTAACMMCRREVYEEAQGMNEDLEVEYNDVDLCLRLTHAGYYNVYLPSVELYHYESATRGHPHQNRESYERHVREMEIFKKTWQHIINRDPYYNPNLNLGVHDYSLNFSA